MARVLDRATAPITADDDTLRAVLNDAFLPALLPALAYATGDFGLLRDDLRAARVQVGSPQGGMSAEQQERARALALDALRRLRDDGVRPARRPSVADLDGTLRRISRWMTGMAAGDDYLPLLREELAPAGEDLRAPTWRKDPAVPFSVAIIGAGMSGILAAIRLRQAGVPFVILEKNADVGGTWLENTYPGARVDVANAFYSYSFAQKLDWPSHYSSQPVLLDYFRACTDEYGIRGRIRFGTEVEAATFDERRLTWSLRLRTADGGTEALEAQAVISAVGQLNRPLMPDIPGMDRFAGPSFHSARWRHDIDLAGRRVIVIGTGASAAQFVPAIAPSVARLTLFQRTPPWLVPVPHYYDDIPEGLRWCFRHVPSYAHWHRFWLFWNTTEGLLPSARVDGAWEPKERSVSKANDDLRALFTRYLEAQFGDRPDLLAKVLPAYPPGAKRMVLDNGIWATTLKRENVDLITEPIAAITPAGVRTTDGREHEADVIIYGTGFQASRFLTPMTITGRSGADLQVRWNGDARAYLGITVPGFPNFFMLYGPNTNIVVNGSIIYFSECEVRYILGCIHLLLERGAQAMDCRPAVHDAYNERIDAGNRKMVWGVSTVNSWYKNATGRVAQN